MSLVVRPPDTLILPPLIVPKWRGLRGLEEHAHAHDLRHEEVVRLLPHEQARADDEEHERERYEAVHLVRVGRLPRLQPGLHREAHREQAPQDDELARGVVEHLGTWLAGRFAQWLSPTTRTSRSARGQRIAAERESGSVRQGRGCTCTLPCD